MQRFPRPSLFVFSLYTELREVKIMKYKILVSGGNSALLRDFFVSAVDFSCMSTSTYWADICAHCELFKPNAFVCIVEYVDIPLITQIKRLKATEE